jgi:hypothetical protein
MLNGRTLESLAALWELRRARLVLELDAAAAALASASAALDGASRRLAQSEARLQALDAWPASPQADLRLLGPALAARLNLQGRVGAQRSEVRRAQEGVGEAEQELRDARGRLAAGLRRAEGRRRIAFVLAGLRRAAAERRDEADRDPATVRGPAARWEG